MNSVDKMATAGLRKTYRTLHPFSMGECPHPEQVGDRWLVEVTHPAIFAYRASVAHKMTERYKIEKLFKELDRAARRRSKAGGPRERGEAAKDPQ
jgi:hypothetical protein